MRSACFAILGVVFACLNLTCALRPKGLKQATRREVELRQRAPLPLQAQASPQPCPVGSNVRDSQGSCCSTGLLADDGSCCSAKGLYYSQGVILWLITIAGTNTMTNSCCPAGTTYTSADDTCCPSGQEYGSCSDTDHCCTDGIVLGFVRRLLSSDMETLRQCPGFR